MLKLKKRAEKLEEKAQSLMAEAKRVAAQYQQLVDAEVGTALPICQVLATDPIHRNPDSSLRLRTAMTILLQMALTPMPFLTILTTTAAFPLRSLHRTRFLPTSPPTKSCLSIAD